MNWIRRVFHKSPGEKSLDKELQFHSTVKSPIT